MNPLGNHLCANHAREARRHKRIHADAERSKLFGHVQRETVQSRFRSGVQGLAAPRVNVTRCGTRDVYDAAAPRTILAHAVPPELLGDRTAEQQRGDDVDVELLARDALDPTTEKVGAYSVASAVDEY